MKYRYESLIFDYDGVIVISEGPRFAVLQAAAAAHGVVLSDESFHQMKGRTTRVFFDAVIPEVTAEVQRAIIGDYEREYKGNNVAHVTPIEATVDFIRGYHGAIPLGLASTADYSVIEMITKHLGIFDAFGTIVSKGDIARLKPDPQAYLLAAERLGVNAARCAVVEDTVVGARAALAAGMATYALLNGENSETDFEGLEVGFVRTTEDIYGIVREG